MLQLRALLIPALLITALSGARLGAEDRLASLQFIDGKSRSQEDFKDQTLIIVYFCGVCPRSGAWMRDEAKQLHDFIEQEHLPGTVVYTTHDKTIDDLMGMQKEVGLEHALMAVDPVNSLQVGLSNIFQAVTIKPSGRSSPWMMNLDAPKGALKESDAGTWRFDVPDLSGKAKELWWMCERGYPDAFKTLISAAKSSPIKADAARILETVKTVFGKKQDELIAAPATIETYEALEKLVSSSEGIDLKPAKERLKALGKDPTLKDELQARSFYQKCNALAGSNKESEQKAAKSNFAEVAKRFPETKYGKMAAAAK